MNVDKCIAGVWRINTISNKLNFKFQCCLETNLEGSPESGEGFIAQSFENDSIRITMGTEDEEGFEKHVGSKWLPKHFKNQFYPNLFEYLKNGISVTLPSLFKNDFVEVHFLVAWSSSKDIATWYAVDQPIKEILQKAEVD